MSNQANDLGAREGLLELELEVKKAGLRYVRRFLDEDSEKEDDDSDLHKPLWDSFDNVYRCVECNFEVVEGICEHCLTEYDWDPENEEHPECSMSIENEALKSERCLGPRDTTPLRDVYPSGVPSAYYGRTEEFQSLLERGATRLMCETFYLSFTHETGIIAWADGDIYDTFAGPAMKKGDFWKIHLGRRIELDEDDFDGSQFLEGLLEDVLLFSMKPPTSDRVTVDGKWETVEESPGIWVTRLTARDVDTVESDDDRDSLGFNDEDYNEHDELLQTQDKALEGSGYAPENPVLHSDRYESSSDEADSDIEMADGDDVEEIDTGYAWQANVPDRVYYDPIDESVNGDDDEEGGSTGTLMEESDSADSDFDSDELLSGDEGTLLSGVKLCTWN